MIKTHFSQMRGTRVITLAFMLSFYENKLDKKKIR